MHDIDSVVALVRSVASWIRLWGTLVFAAQVLLSAGLVALWVLHVRRSERHAQQLADLASDVEYLREQSARDDLTGVYRRGYGEHMAQLALRVMPCAVVFIDLDDFGQINKHQGHDAGDRALQDVTKRLLDVFRREHDIVYRYGGDEFVIVLPALPSDIDPQSEDARMAQGRELDRVLNYAAKHLAVLAVDSVPFTYAITDTQRYSPSQALRAAESEVRHIKNRRDQQREAAQAVDAAQPVAPNEEPADERLDLPTLPG